jgi:hypothetical protein
MYHLIHALDDDKDNNTQLVIYNIGSRLILGLTDPELVRTFFEKDV